MDMDRMNNETCKILFENHLSGSQIDICMNKATGKYFIFIEETTNRLRLITPDCEIKLLNPNLFEEMETFYIEECLSSGIISTGQIIKFISALPKEPEPDKTIETVQMEGKRFGTITNAGHNQIDIWNIANLLPGNVRQYDMYDEILRALQWFGRPATKEEVEDIIYKKFKSEFSKEWYQEFVANSVPRWKHNIAWAKEKLKHDGLIKPPSESKRGIWELTEKGKKT